MKRYLIYLSIIATACSPLNNTRLLHYPPEDFRLSNTLLKTNGYYYCEKERTAYCRYISEVQTGLIPDTTSLYKQKYISAFFLYQDGYTYFTGGLITTGVNQRGAMALNDHCHLINEFNTHAQARTVFENHLSRNYIGNDGINDKGIFIIKSDSLFIQVYESGAYPLILTEYQGLILNDTTFTLFKELSYTNGKKPKIVALSDTYRFKSHPLKADSTNYLRNHRAKLTRRHSKK